MATGVRAVVRGRYIAAVLDTWRHTIRDEWAQIEPGRPQGPSWNPTPIDGRSTACRPSGGMHRATMGGAPHCRPYSAAAAGPPLRSPFEARNIENTPAQASVPGRGGLDEGGIGGNGARDTRVFGNLSTRLWRPGAGNRSAERVRNRARENDHSPSYEAKWPVKSRTPARHLPIHPRRY